MHLGRCVGELKGALDQIEASPHDGALRDELRSRIGALAATARTFALSDVNDRLALAQRSLEGPSLGPAALVRLRTMLDDLPSLAWSDSSFKTPVGGAQRIDPLARPPASPLRGATTPLLTPNPAPGTASPRVPSPLASPRAPSSLGSPTPLASPSPRSPAPLAAPSPRAPSAPLASPAPRTPRAPEPAKPAPTPPDPRAQPRWGSEPDAEATIPSAVTWPTTTLVVGGLSLTNALAVGDAGSNRAPLEWERCEKPEGALDLARALAPDVILLDGDLPGADEFAQRLGVDALTEPVPLVVVGHFRTPDEAARWLALGAFQVLSRPASPDAIRNACLAAVAAPHRPSRPEPVGERSLDDLAALLSEELRQGLVGSTSDGGRALKVALGDGHDVRAALWGAIARIRDVVSQKTNGVVRFSGGPEGALPLASLLTDSLAGTRPEPAPESAAGSETELAGRRVLVVDDDPAVRWFLLGLFRAAGATVFEATDGNDAFALACRALPDLVVSDVIMPGRDGFALCRSIKRDLVLRDVAVILLSWKEELLQRMRELGASADGYLRKEANASAVLARAREVLKPRARLEARLPGEGEVRGRLDGLTVRTLLSLVARHRPDARVSVRDASFLYEVDVREGAPRRATRTTSDGAFERGARVIAGLVGVGAGRFVVTSSLSAAAAAKGDLRGSLDEQLFDPVCRARAAQRLLSESGLLNVKRVGVDLGAVEAYLEATPEPMRSHVRAIAGGAPPRSLVLKGAVPAALLERLLDDVIAHGGLTEIVGALDDDLLSPAVEYERAVLRSPAPSSSEPGPLPVIAGAVATPSYLDTAPLPLISPPNRPQAPFEAPPVPSSRPAALHAGHVIDVGTVQPQNVVEITTPLHVSPPNGPGQADYNLPATPPALPDPSGSYAQEGAPAGPYAYQGAATPSYPMPAAQPPGPQAYGAPPAYGTPSPTPPNTGVAPAPAAQTAPMPPPNHPGAPPPRATPSGSPRVPPAPPPRAPMATPSRLYAAPPHVPAPKPATPSGPAAPAPAPAPRPAAPVQAAPTPVFVPRPLAIAPVEEAEPPTSRGRVILSWVLSVLLLTSVSGGVWWYSRGKFDDAPAPTATPTAPTATLAPSGADVAPAPPASVAPPNAAGGAASAGAGTPPAPSAAVPSASAAKPTIAPGAVAVEGEDGPLPASGTPVPPGYGLLEVKFPKKSEIFIDRLNMGVGPQLSLPLPPGAHELRLSSREDRPLALTIRPGRRTALDLRTAWPAR